MVVYVVVTSFLRNVAFLIYALFGEIPILEIPVVGIFFSTHNIWTLNSILIYRFFKHNLQCNSIYCYYFTIPKYF